MSLLSIVQRAARRIGITAPDVVANSSDLQSLQLLEIANAECEDLANRYPWQALQKAVTFTTVATESQGSLSSIADDIEYIINNTIWNRDTRRPIFGPLTPQDRQLLQASPITGPFEQYSIRGDTLLFDPVPTAGQTCAFEYISNELVESSGGTGQELFQADTDVPKLSERIITSGIVWRWKQIKGFDYAQDFSTYESMVADAMARDGTKPVLDMGGGITDFQPGIWVPQTGYGS